jgi:Tol biopolymer transport system component
MRETIVIILTVSVLCFEIAAQPAGKISYQSSEDWQIYIMDVESGERTKITHDMRRADINAFLSNEGSRIATSVDLDRDGDKEIHIIDMGSGRRWRLTNNPWNENHPRWSPDGKHIAFSSAITDSISIMNDDGGNEGILIENAYYPSWSPCRLYAVLPHERTSVPWGALKALRRVR